MTSFDARLRLLGHSGMPLGVEVDLDDGRMIVTSDDKEVANWSLDDIRIVVQSDGFHFKAEGEEVILNVTDTRRFASEIGLTLD